MYKAKLTALLLAGCMLLCSCGGQKNDSEVLLYQEKEDSQKEEYKTTKVKKGVYEEKVSEVGELYYTDENIVSIDEENAYLDKICVKHNQKIKKGDVVAVYHIKTSKASLNKQKLLIEQARTQYDSGLRSKRSEVLAKEKSIKSLTSEAEKRIARIELKQLKNEYKQMVKAGSDIRQQEKDYQELLRKQKKTNLKAKYSGRVIEPVAADADSDEPISGTALMKIRNEDEFLVSVKDDMGKLRYNMTVDIGLGTTSDEIKYKVKGKVISTTNLMEGGTAVEVSEDSDVSGEGGGGEAQLIKVSKSDMKKYAFKKYNLFVTGVTFRIENALLVDAEAVNEKVEEENAKLFVYLVENGKLHQRYITSNYKQDKVYLVNQGVEEGQTLAIVK